jgi:hypothetical protein
MTLCINVGVAGGDDKHQPIRLIHTQVLHQAPLVFEMKRRQLCWQGGGLRGRRKIGARMGGYWESVAGTRVAVRTSAKDW